MRKMGVGNVVELVRRSIELGFLPIPVAPHDGTSSLNAAQSK
jgi:hypothetical protein